MNDRQVLYSEKLFMSPRLGSNQQPSDEKFTVVTNWLLITPYKGKPHPYLLANILILFTDIRSALVVQSINTRA